MSETSNHKRAIVLASALDLPDSEREDLLELHAGDTDAATGEEVFSANGGEYIVLTDEEADERCADYIRESLWAFNPDFLAAHSCAPSEAFEAIAANGKCESNSEIIEEMIDDFDEFVADAIRADGRGHFLAPHDGDEIEAGEFYIYRVG